MKDSGQLEQRGWVADEPFCPVRSFHDDVESMLQASCLPWSWADECMGTDSTRGSILTLFGRRSSVWLIVWHELRHVNLRSDRGTDRKVPKKGVPRELRSRTTLVWSRCERCCEHQTTSCMRGCAPHGLRMSACSRVVKIRPMTLSKGRSVGCGLILASSRTSIACQMRPLRPHLLFQRYLRYRTWP